MKKSVKSLNQCKSVIQTRYDFVKANASEIKVESKEVESTEFTIQIPFN